MKKNDDSSKNQQPSTVQPPAEALSGPEKKRADTEKLQKVLARAGLGSRREMEAVIASGQVTVNGQVATLGDRVQSSDRIHLRGRPLRIQAEAEMPRRIIMYNKPEGELVTRKDPEGRRTVFDHLPRLKGERWVAIGRLDINTSGLLLFTNDGELANRLMHPSHQIEREYAVRVMGEVTDAMLQVLREGVMLEDGLARFAAIQKVGGEGINTWYHAVITEGRNREVRRLWESQGVTVSRLKRVRYGSICLDKRTKMGEWIELTQPEADHLSALAGLKPRAKTPEPAPRKETKGRKPVHAIGKKRR